MISSIPLKYREFLEINSLNKLTSSLEATFKLTQRGTLIMSSVLRTTLQQGCRCGSVFVLSVCVCVHLCTSAYTWMCVLRHIKLYIYGAGTLTTVSWRCLTLTVCFNVIGSSWSQFPRKAPNNISQHFYTALMVSTEIECLLHYNLLESAQTQLPVSRATVQAKHTQWKSFTCPFFLYYRKHCPAG